MGDTIAGTLQIDTNLAPPDQPTTGPSTAYYSGASNFITGYVGNEGVPLDWVMLEDGFLGTDDLVLTEKYQDGVIEAHLQIVVEDAQLDFISGDSLVQQFTLTAADGVDAFRGSVFRKTAAIDRWAWFDLDYLSVGPVSVPEPASLTLLAAGLGFLGVGRATRTRRRRGSQTV